MPTFRSGDLDVYYERHGSGPRVLLCNGSGGTIEALRPLVDVLAAKFTVAIHDQRGLGKTGLSATPASCSMATYASDVATLLDHLEWPTANVVGISFGGMVALEFAVTFPQRVERLALLCTSPGGAGGSSYPLHELASLSTDERARLRPQLSDTRFSDQWLDEHPRDAAMVADVEARAADEPTLQQAAGILWQLEARRHHDVWDRLSRILSPTFIGAGQFDGTAPLANSEAMASRIPTSVLHVYQGGHAFMLQDRAALVDLIGFLDANNTA